MRVLFGTLIFREINRVLYEKGDEKYEKEKRNFWINCRFFIDNIYRRTLVNLVTHQIFKKSLKTDSSGIMLGLSFFFFREIYILYYEKQVAQRQSNRLRSVGCRFESYPISFTFSQILQSI